MDAISENLQEIKSPQTIESEEEATVVAYVNDEGEFLHQEDVKTPEKTAYNQVEKDYELISGELVSKTHELSRQSRAELSEGVLTKGFNKKDIVNPPYPPKCLANFFEVDPVFSRAVKAKVLDFVGRDLSIKSTLPVNPDNAELEDDREMPQGSITPQQFSEDKDKILSFIETCNETIGFRGVLERAAMDYESIGWAGIEVIRSKDGRIAGIEHIPAQRLRVLRGFKGFVEVLSDTTGDNVSPGGDFRCYQPFGEKFKVEDQLGDLVRYNPNIHNDENNEPPEFEENFIDFKTGKPTSDFNKSANEILYFPKHHSNTIYYGYSDVLPALGSIVGNVYIRDYILQFFEHNTIPRYAVIIKGAKVDDDFRKMITQYFSEHVKGQSHKTLILTIQGQAQKDIEIEFKELDSQRKEADFLETQKSNDNRIITAMGTSPAILGIAEHSELGSGKGLSQAEIYKDRIVTPGQRYWAERLNLLFSRGLGCRFAKVEFDPLDIRDLLLEAEYWTELQDRGDVSINEVRAATKTGEPIKGGDEHFVRIKEGSLVKVQDIPSTPAPQGFTDGEISPPTNNENEEDNEDSANANSE